MIGVGLVLVGLGVFLEAAWLVTGELGPRTAVAGQVVNLTTSSSARSGTSYEVDVVWDGGEGSLISGDLYDALYPLGDPAPVTVDRSLLTGTVQRVELRGTWYESDEAPNAGLAAFGVAGLVFAVVLGRALLRGRHAGARDRSPA